MRGDPNAVKLWLRWSEALADWIVCDAVDKGAILFHRAVVNS